MYPRKRDVFFRFKERSLFDQNRAKLLVDPSERTELFDDIIGVEATTISNPFLILQPVLAFRRWREDQCREELIKCATGVFLNEGSSTDSSRSGSVTRC